MKYTLAILLLVFVVGCSKDPRNTKLPKDISQLHTIKPAVEKLTDNEKSLLASYLMMHSMGTAPGPKLPTGGTAIPEDITIGQAIKEQEAFLSTLTPDQIRHKYFKDQPASAK